MHLSSFLVEKFSVDLNFWETSLKLNQFQIVNSLLDDVISILYFIGFVEKSLNVITQFCRYAHVFSSSQLFLC